MAFLAVHFGKALASFQAMQSDPLVKYLLVGGVILVVGVLLFLLNRAHKKALRAALERAAAGGSP
jgi:hypothetical protein